jgi:ABC-type transport system involved in Fe-S cluster assembly fused permease/ATPase subunit
MLYYYSGSPFVISFLTCYGIYTAFTLRYSNYRQLIIRKLRGCERQLDFITSETFANYYNVKYFQKEQHELDKYKKGYEQYYDTLYEQQRTLGVLNTVQRFIFGAGLTFNLVLAAHYTQKGILSTGDIIMIQTLMMQFLHPLFFLGSMYRSFNDTFIDVR